MVCGMLRPITDIVFEPRALSVLDFAAESVFLIFLVVEP